MEVMKLARIFPPRAPGYGIEPCNDGAAAGHRDASREFTRMAKWRPFANDPRNGFRKDSRCFLVGGALRGGPWPRGSGRTFVGPPSFEVMRVTVTESPAVQLTPFDWAVFSSNACVWTGESAFHECAVMRAHGMRNREIELAF